MQKIRTDHPVMPSREVITRDIAAFWNTISEGFRTAWGPHIHHGYFEKDDMTPLAAQEMLIEKLLAFLDLSPPHRLLDVGCGMGGSSIYLAKNYGVEVTGINLSQRQVDMAARSAVEEGVGNVHFKVEDALVLASFANAAFDTVWSVESCEQFYDKNLFIQQAFRVLKPGGSFVLATWCSSADIYEGREAKKYKKLCRAFQLPYMPTIDHYRHCLQEQGFALKQALNWSEKVGKSWAIGLAHLGAGSVLNIYKTAGWTGLRFMKNAKLMRCGFQERRIEYGVFVARKPL